jgi:chromosome segregation ATPase
MIRIDQIRKLETKIQEAVELISQYKEENRLLKNRLSNYEGRIAELENLIDQYRDEQGEIEQGIIKALEHLDSLEGVVGSLKEDNPVDSVIAEQEADAVQREIEARQAGVDVEDIVSEAAGTEQPELEDDGINTTEDTSEESDSLQESDEYIESDDDDVEVDLSGDESNEEDDEVVIEEDYNSPTSYGNSAEEISEDVQESEAGNDPMEDSEQEDDTNGQLDIF